MPKFRQKWPYVGRCLDVTMTENKLLCKIRRSINLKKSKTMWFLIVFFIWATLKSAGSLYSYESVSDYALLSSIGFVWLFFILNIAIMVLEASTAFLLITKKPAVLMVGGILAILACLNGVLITAISVLNLEIVKSIYIASREARGMTINQDAMGFMFTSQGLIVMCLAYITFYTLICYLLYKVKNEMVDASA